MKLDDAKPNEVYLSDPASEENKFDGRLCLYIYIYIHIYRERVSRAEQVMREMRNQEQTKNRPDFGTFKEDNCQQKKERNALEKLEYWENVYRGGVPAYPTSKVFHKV